MLNFFQEVFGKSEEDFFSEAIVVLRPSLRKVRNTQFHQHVPYIFK